MKKIVITGCYHSLNSGVMAMAESIIQNIPDSEISILSSPEFIENDKLRYNIYSNVRLIPIPWFSGDKYLNIFKLFFSLLGFPFYKEFRKELNQSDVLVDISGDSISNDYGTKSIFFQLIPIFLVSKKVKVLFAPQTMGPFIGIIQTLLVKKAFKKATDIYLRETESKKYLTKFSDFNFKVSADLAFLLQPLPPITHFKIKDRTIGVGVSALVKKIDDEYSSILIKQIIDKCLEKNYNVLLINHVSTPQGNDIIFANSIKEKYFSDDERVTNTNLNFRASEWKYLVSKCSGVISARMHPIVHALSLSLPSLNLSYNHKSIGVVQQRFAPFGQVTSVYDKDALSKVESFLQGFETLNHKKFKEITQKNILLAKQFINQIA